MIKSFLIQCCLIFSTLICVAQQEQVFKTTPKSVIGYIEYLPPDYHQNNDKYPIVIFLHGKGQSGPTSNDPAVLKTGYSDLVFYGPPKFVRLGTNFPFILVCPQLKNSYGNWPSSYVMEVIEHVRKYLRVDPNRIYLTGTSLGGGGAWTTAQDYPDYFAAVAPVAGSTNNTGKACGIADSDLPVWAFHGDQDRTIPLSRSVNMVNAINNCGASVKAKISIYKGLGHNAYSKAYDPYLMYQDPDLYEWMLAQVNNNGTIPSNSKPTAKAGADQTIILPTTKAVLTGTGTDADGIIIDYSWSQVSGATPKLKGTRTSLLTVNDLSAGTYVFKLLVRDNKGGIDTDDITITVKSSGSNAAPTASAGLDKTVQLPTNSIKITGTASDPDGSISSYAWTKVSGGAATLSNASTATVTASGLVEGVYTFRLSVTDNNGATKSDDVKVTVNAASNTAPVANAGSDKTLQIPINTVTLEGSASDSDGSIVSYNWTKVSGGNASLSGATSARVNISGLVQGTYVFRLTVKDDKSATDTDDVTVTVKAPVVTKPNPEPTNIAPVANAGSDKSLQIPINTVSLPGAGSDSDGEIVSYTWTKVSGGNATIKVATTTRVNVVDLEPGTYVFRLTVKDDKGGIGTDDVKVTVRPQDGDSNILPVANAGDDTSIQIPINTVSLQGSGSDADGQIVSYSWTKVSGGKASLTYATESRVNVADLEVGTYVFRLTVKDNKSATDADDITVTVRPSDDEPEASPIEIGPFSADAGPDRTVELPVSSVDISAEVSTPSGTSIESYEWIQVAGTPVDIKNANTATLTISGVTNPSTKAFKLTVYNSLGYREIDHVRIVYKEGSTASSGRMAMAAEIETTKGEEEESEQGDLTSCNECHVVVYNETLKPIYNDKWTAASYDQIFTERGLYIYQISKNGRIIKRGKIFRQ
ncbi:MAG TPA: PKD domain-containing protein [Ohtaekwangia sp.]|nr:PKD domain-containing protein [Ohtaekwangia sp.]